MAMLPKHIVDKIMLCVSHPIADDLYYIFEECNFVSGFRCDECRTEGWLCMCAYRNSWIGKTEKLYICKKPSYKMEKILEMKLVLRWLLSKSDVFLYLHARLTETTLEERLDIVYYEKKKLEEQYPIYFHCNKELISNCTVMLLRQNTKSFRLRDYEDLYDSFDH